MSKKFEDLTQEELMGLVLLTHSEHKEKEKKSNRRFHIVCHTVGGLNLASGNVSGWLVCIGISGVYSLVSRYR